MLQLYSIRKHRQTLIVNSMQQSPWQPTATRKTNKHTATIQHKTTPRNLDCEVYAAVAMATMQHKTTPGHPDYEVYAAVVDRALKRSMTCSLVLVAVAAPPRLQLNSATKPTKLSSAYAQNSSGEPNASTWYSHSSHIMWNLGFTRQPDPLSSVPSPKLEYIKHNLLHVSAMALWFTGFAPNKQYNSKSDFATFKIVSDRVVPTCWCNSLATKTPKGTKCLVSAPLARNLGDLPLCLTISSVKTCKVVVGWNSL